MKANNSVSRRALLSATVLVPLLLPEPEQAQVLSPTGSAHDLMGKAVADVRDTSTTLSKIAIPMHLEPAFVFHP